MINPASTTPGGLVKLSAKRSAEKAVPAVDLQDLG
jgi:hypothetical protein